MIGKIDIPLYAKSLHKFGYPDNDDLINELIQICRDYTVSSWERADATYYSFSITREDESYIAMKYPNFRLTSWNITDEHRN